MYEPTFASSSPRRIRRSNSIAALQALFEHGSLSRAELARHLGLNRSSSGSIVSELAASGLVHEVDDQERDKRAGRPGILLELDPQAAFFAGAEIGVEHITTLQINLMADICSFRVEPFDGRTVSAEKAVQLAVRQAFDGMPANIAEGLEGFGLSAPGQMDRKGRVSVAPLLGWKDADLAGLTKTALDGELPVLVDNEANAFAFGESYRNHESKTGVTLVLVIETGVGGGVVIDGKVFRGGHGLAGEIGHLNMSDGKELEQSLGLDHLLRCHQSELGLPESSLARVLADVRDRVPAAVTIAEEWARNLASALVTACRLIDPDRIVLGGSVSALYPLVEARVTHYVRASQAESFPMPTITVHDAADTGAAYGAACLLHRRFLSLGNESLAEQAVGKDPER